MTHPSPGHALQAHNQFLALPTGLVPTASHNWKLQLQQDNDRTHRPFTPLAWARHCLGLNLVSALSSHVHRALAVVRRKARTPRTRPLHVLGNQYFTTQPYNILDPCPGFLRVETESPSLGD